MIYENIEDYKKDIKKQEYYLSLKKDYYNLINSNSYKKIIDKHLFDFEVKECINNLNISEEHDKEMLLKLKSIKYLKQFLDSLFTSIEKAPEELNTAEKNLSEVLEIKKESNL